MMIRSVAVVWCWVGVACASQAGPSLAPSVKNQAAHAVLASCLDTVERDGSVARLPACLGDLHTRPGCRAAWRDGAGGLDQRAIAAIATVCAREYCPQLSPPTPILCRTQPAEYGEAPTLVLHLAELEGVVLAAEVELGKAPGLLARLTATLVAMVVIGDSAGVTVELPRAAPGGSRLTLPGAVPGGPRLTLVVSVPESGPVMLGLRVVSDDELGERLRDSVAGDVPVSVALDADESVSYARVVEVMDIIRAAGVTDFALVTE